MEPIDVPLTQPPISVAQNTEHCQRLLAAQSRLYTDAKQSHDVRILIIGVVAALTIAAALVFPEARQILGGIGGGATFVASLWASRREKQRRRVAACVQEEFDTHVFRMSWNSIFADHPSPTVIAESARRYKGNRTRDWYPDTGQVARPLDVLICQRSNLGWGSSVHRFYAGCLTAVGAVTGMACLGIGLAAGFTISEWLFAMVVPLLGPARELIDMVRAHTESAETKTKAEAQVLELWRRGKQAGENVSIQDCREMQDRILTIRQSNAHIPDWIDNIRRGRNEEAMQEAARHMIDEAQ
jgi:hypothetical protein